MIFNLILGVGGLVLSGDSIGQGIRKKDAVIICFGLFELGVGLYFMIAAIGS